MLSALLLRAMPKQMFLLMSGVLIAHISGISEGCTGERTALLLEKGELDFWGTSAVLEVT